MKKETKRLIVTGIAILLGSGAFAVPSEAHTHSVTDSSNDNIDIKGNWDVGICNESNKELNFDGESIDIDTLPGTGWKSGNVGVWAQAQSIGRSVINLGAKSTENIKINVVDPTNKKDIAVGIWASGPDKPNAIGNGGLIKIEGKNLSVTGNSETGTIYGIYAQNKSTVAGGEKAEIDINTDNTYINVTANGKDNAHGIVAMSQGIINIKSNLEGHAENVITARGNATVKINTEGNHTTKLYGDLNFNYDEKTSGTVVDADVDIRLNGAESVWEGNTKVTYDLDKKSYNDIVGDGKLTVDSVKLSLSNGAVWTPTAIENSDINEKSGTQYTNLNKLSLENGVINLDSSKLKENFIPQIDKVEGAGTIATNSLDNQVKVKDATDSDITVKGTGNIADLIASDSANAQKLANTAVGADNKTIAKNIKASAATIAGEYSAQVDENGKVFNEVKSQNQTNLSISKLGALSLMTWRQENNDMNKRLGEIRDSQGEQGIWARMSRGEAKYGSQGVKNQYNYYQLGYDHKIADDWILGGAFTYTDGENNLVGGSGTNKNTGFAVYGSNLRDDGSFIDLIAKYAHMKNDFDTISGVGIGEYSTNGYALSAEYGKRFQQDGFWIEPQAELTYGKVSSADFTTSEGAKVHQDSLDSLVGRLGFSLGKDVKAGNVYVRASYLYDFKGDVAMRMSNGVASDTYDQDLGGSWWEFGVGTNLNFGKDMHFYFDVERTEGGKVDTPWQWNAGVRLSF